MLHDSQATTGPVKKHEGVASEDSSLFDTSNSENEDSNGGSGRRLRKRSKSASKSKVSGLLKQHLLVAFNTHYRK